MDRAPFTGGCFRRGVLNDGVADQKGGKMETLRARETLKARWVEILEDIALAVLGFVAVFLVFGCAQMFSANTKVHVETTADGACTADYSSSKEQEGLEASVCGGRIQTAKSGTLESAVAAAMQLQLKLAGILEQLTPLLKNAAAAGAGS
jgi:hypothetical protein